jgi:hypothetical protein
MGDIIQGIGSIIGGNAAASADRHAADVQQQMFEETKAGLQPYNTAGQAVLPSLNALAMSGPTGGGPDYVSMAAANLPGTMTQAELEQTPGYQFARSQGLKAVQSANAAKGLGVSGAALKGAAAFATGLADSTYQNQFTNQQNRFVDINSLNTGQQTQLQNEYTRLHDTAALGANAAATTATAGTQAAANQGNALINAGNAEAQGTKGLATGIGNTINQGIGFAMAPSGPTSFSGGGNFSNAA